MDSDVVIEGLSIGYGRGRVVAGGISGRVAAGELTCLLGANGVGKSTLLRTLSGFLPPLAGSVGIGGRDVSSVGARELSRLVGVVLTDKPDVQAMTVAELVGLGRSPYTDFWGRLTADDRRVVGEALAMVGIEGLAGRMVETLSDGERQKVMIAKALAQQTPVVLLDEPTAFLDFPSKVGIMRLLRRISREVGKTVFLSTHDVELAVQTADTLWLMSSGGSIACGSPRELADDGSLGSFFAGAGISFDRRAGVFRVEAD